MMPGVNQSGAGGIASEATSGTCQNCTVLNESLEEYVSALLTLKQKIIDTDRLLGEYKEKCDELQKSQRESAKLHKELDEVLLKLGPLEKQTAEYEAVRAELEETKATLKVYQVKSEELKALREENAATIAMNSKLQEAIKTAEDAARTQSLESTKLRSEKQMLESNLQKTQESLRQCQHAVEEVENLKLQNAKALILKSNVENQLLALEDMSQKQHHTIHELTCKNVNLENSMRLLEEKLATMEKEFNKETRCTSTQTETEPKVDKAKVWRLLQEVWQCVDPLSKTKADFYLNDNQCLRFGPSRSPPPCPVPASPFRNPMPWSAVSTPTGPKVSPEKSKANATLASACSRIKVRKIKKMDRKKKRSVESVQLDESCAKTNEVNELSLNKDGCVDGLFEAGPCGESPDVWEILSLSWAIPALLSPLPPDDMAEMEVDLSLKEASDDGQQSAEPNPLNRVDASSVCLSPGNQLSTSRETSPITSDTDKESKMQMDNMCKIQESPAESPCTVSPAGLAEGLDGDQVNLNPVSITTAESQLSTEEEQTNQTKPDLLQGDCNDCEQDVSEPVQLVIIPDQCSDEKGQSEVDANQDMCSNKETETLVEEAQSDLKTAEDLNGVASGDSSDEDGFLDVKRKVRGFCSRPAGLDSVTSNGKEEQTEARVQETQCKTKDEHLQPEKGRNDECGKGCSVTANLCDPVIPDGDANVDVNHETRLAQKCADESENPSNNTLTVLDEQNQEEFGRLSPNIENKADGLKVDDDDDDDAIPKKTNVKFIFPASSLKSFTLHRRVNLPLKDVASGNLLTSTRSPESIGRVLSEMGPPLPPVVLPLTATPPKFRKHLTPNRPSIQLPTCSSTVEPFSLNQQSNLPSSDPGLQDEVKTLSLPETTPSPSREVPNSPLQFGSATPKHALPVPGRLPSSALTSSSPSAAQENSMQILDTMYPELSAQARTLNILRGKVGLGRAANENGVSPPPVNPISGNKTINSSSTAFKKTEQKAKRIGANVLLPKSAKRLRLDTFSPDPASLTPPVQPVTEDKPSNDEASPAHCTLTGPSGDSQTAGSKTVQRNDSNDAQSDVCNALEKLHHSCFDLLPVIRSHVFLGRISDVPALRDEEKSVISDFCIKQSTAEELMLTILSKVKQERAGMQHELLQSYCRVYVGLCRWRGDCQKVHALAYSLLKEGYPESPKLILFMVTTWPDILSHDGPLCRAVNIVSKLRAEGEISDCLSKYLHWDERPPGDIHETITNMLKALLEDATLMFQKHDRHGYDLCPAAWDYAFSLDLLCSQLGWKWTHDNIIGKELWPVMNAWVTQPRSQQTPVRDICVAVVLRLIGRLGQLGIKEKLSMSVHNVAKAINLFGRHGITEGVPWEVQLSAVYAIYDLSPSNPKEALEALASWRSETKQLVPPAVTSCITQIGSVCRHIEP